jgi:hypothetical protein
MPARKEARRGAGCLGAIALAAALALGACLPAHAAERYRWKAVTEGQVKLDGKIPLTWNLYQPDKKKESNLLLLLLGHRWLLLDTKAKLVYQALPADLHAEGTDYESDDLAKPETIVPSTDWTDRDVGPAEDIHVMLEDYGRVLEVELPHLMDLRRGLY